MRFILVVQRVSYCSDYYDSDRAYEPKRTIEHASRIRLIRSNLAQNDLGQHHDENAHYLIANVTNLKQVTVTANLYNK